uniref:beta-galactosidase 9-like n=1 Tax=Erigeron canadensis TaxID=72917 RepID=UPI001CB8A200|nr:beta-galactosidase 9-like [Erigeron canadensis]
MCKQDDVPDAIVRTGASKAVSQMLLFTKFGGEGHKRHVEHLAFAAVIQKGGSFVNVSIIIKDFKSSNLVSHKLL